MEFEFLSGEAKINVQFAMDTIVAVQTLWPVRMNSEAYLLGLLNRLYRHGTRS